MRRLRAVAAIVALAVIWLGFTVARQIAAERSGRVTALAQAAAPEPVRGRRTVLRVKKKEAPPETASHSTAQVATVAMPELPESLSSTVVAPAEAAVVPDAVPGEAVSAEPAHVPFLQAAMQSAQAGPGYRANRAGGGAFGGTGMGSMSGGGHAGAAASPVVDEPLAGDGRPEVLGHRFSSSEDGNTDTNSNGNNGSNGSSGSNGSNGSNGNNGSNGSNGNSGNPGNNASTAPSGGSGGSNQGGNGGSNAGGNGGSNAGGNGGTSDVPDGGRIASIDGDNDVRAVPEPGSILFGVGAALALIRRRAR